jgi:hypothetical protein
MLLGKTGDIPARSRGNLWVTWSKGYLSSFSLTDLFSIPKLRCFDALRWWTQSIPNHKSIDNPRRMNIDHFQTFRGLNAGTSFFQHIVCSFFRQLHLFSLCIPSNPWRNALILKIILESLKVTEKNCLTSLINVEHNAPSFSRPIFILDHANSFLKNEF